MFLDRETLALLRVVFEEACGLLPPHKRTHEMRSALAVRILRHAAKGERNPARLRTYALAETTGPQSSHSVASRRSARSPRNNGSNK
jgi:hypothetical protein